MDEITEESKERLQGEYDRLVKIIESFERLDKSEEWATLKELVFSKSLGGIERLILNESLASEIDTNKLYKLQGEWVWAKQYNDINRFVDTLKKQLSNIKTKIS